MAWSRTLIAAIVGVTALVGFKLFRIWRARQMVQVAPLCQQRDQSMCIRRDMFRLSAPIFTAPSWTTRSIENSLSGIDWYQFEKYCAALLLAEGLRVD
jgi:hypothetical protein